MSERETLTDSLRHRGELARRVSFYTDFYRLPDAVQQALYGLAAQVEEAADALDLLMRATWDAYAATGADTDSDEKWHCSPEMAAKSLLIAVRDLREDYEASLDHEPWEPREGDRAFHCRHPKLLFCERPLERDGFSVADGSEYFAAFYTGPDFGCVRHEPRSE